MTIIKPSEKHKHRVVNFATGEVFDCDFVQPLRSRVKEMAKQLSFNISDMQVVSTDYKVAAYLRRVAYEWSYTTCDLCNESTQRRNMELVEDNEGVCLVMYCNDCRDEMTGDICSDIDYAEFEILLDEFNNEV